MTLCFLRAPRTKGGERSFPTAKFTAQENRLNNAPPLPATCVSISLITRELYLSFEFEARVRARVVISLLLVKNEYASPFESECEM